MNFDTCYCAIEHNDERFDGEFFTAVLTTGIYCRPTCHARTPKRENVRFFSTAAAASEAGFRPCLRCRPESAPELFIYNQPSPIVSRALRLMSEGILDEQSLDEFANMLHISTRQLRRYFVDELGAPPIAVAQTRRLLFAKKLIDETRLPMTEVAFSAGYSSIRRFNEAIRQTYGRTPSALRNSRQNKKQAADIKYSQLKLYYCPPFDWPLIMAFLHQRAIPGVEIVENNVYKRTVKFEDTIGIIEVEPVENERYCLVRVPNTLSRHLLTITERVKRIFDLRTNPSTMIETLSKDKELGRLIQKYPGLRVPGAWDKFEVAVRAILGQQISVKAATTFCGRVAEMYGDPVPEPQHPKLTHVFPTPDRLSRATLTEIGLTNKRALTLQTFSKAIDQGDLSLQTAHTLDDAVKSLTTISGIGPWTANYIAMRALSEPDAFPSGDLILRRAASGISDTALTTSQLQQKAENWRPWRAYATLLLWTDYASQSKLEDVAGP
ncbi:MAG: AlkA N-terminal domain-containing protein [Chloroflexota bacterium]